MTHEDAPEQRYTVTLLRAGRLLLDGGSMFGIIPRALWMRAFAPDESNRIELTHNCLLLRSSEPDPELGRQRRVVIETGTGDKLAPKLAGIFGLDGVTVETALGETGVACEDIDDVIVSHLHFDHAGGLTRRCRRGEQPDWIATEQNPPSGDCSSVRRTFPNATVHVQEREWRDALANDSVMTRTYYHDHLEPVSAMVRLVDSPRPFPIGTRPHRDQSPSVPLALRQTEILPGIRVFLVPGHTWGQQAIRFATPDGRSVVFTPDIMPTVHHVGAAYSLAYDVEPYTTMVTKRWFLAEAATGNWLLALDHEPRTPFCSVRPNDAGWYDLVPEHI